MKKSRSSIPRLVAIFEEGDSVPGLDGIAGRPVMEGPDALPPPPAPRVAIAVGKTKEGSEFPAKLRTW